MTDPTTADKADHDQQTQTPTSQREEHSLGKEVDQEEHSHDRSQWPEEAHLSFLAQTWQRWTYSYMNPLLDKGSKQTLDDGTRLSDADLYDVPTDMKAKPLNEKFELLYHQNHPSSTTTSSTNSKNHLLHTLFQMAAPTFVPAGVYEFITVLCQVALPLLIRELLRLLEERPAASIFAQAWPLILGIALCLVINAIANHRHRYLATQSGVVLRSTIVSVVYRRVLQITPQGRFGLAPAEVTNIVAIDTQKLFEVTQEAHLLWAMPLSIVLVTICLVIVLGPTTLIGVVVLLLMVPVVERVASAMLAIRQQRIKLTDKRVEITNAMIQGIKVTKLNHYEENYQQRVDQARNQELTKLRRELFVWALSLVVTVISPSLAAGATFIVYVMANEDHVLTASETFTVLLLFNSLRFPINYFGRLLGRMAQAFTSIERIASYLDRPILHDDDNNNDKNSKSTDNDKKGTEMLPQKTRSNDNDDDAVLVVRNASFRIGSPSSDTATLSTTLSANDAAATVSTSGFRQGDGFEVSGIDFALQRGEILALVGTVGCGKSTIVNGIISEVPASEGTSLSLKGRVAYVSQTAFIMNTSLRENILFGESFEQERYERVLEACCLWPDIELLGEAGDLTEIGERGVTLSGGQQQRVSIARAAYSRPDVVLLDDPLSALDAGTSKTIFDNLKSLLAGSAIVLVTHAAHFLSKVDRIALVSDSRIQFLGTWPELLDFKPHDAKTLDAVEHIRSSVQEDTSEKNETEPNQGTRKSVSNEAGNGRASTLQKSKKIMTVEEREHGLSSLATWLLWFKHAGGIPFIVAHVLFMTIDRFTYVAVEYWLARWTEGAYEPVEVFGITFAPQTDGRSAQADYVLVYVLLIAFSVFSTFLRSEWVVTGGSRAARRVFQSMLVRVLSAPMVYFETTPMGRVLNRFTYDQEIVDHNLTEAMSVLMIALGWGVTSVIVMTVILPWMALAVFPTILFYWWLLLHYRKSGADLQRLDAVARSPIQAMLAEALEGHATMRVFGQSGKFVNKFHSITDSSGAALLNFISAQRWLGIRIEILGAIIVLCATLLVVTLNGTYALEPGIVALLIVWASNFTITLGFVVDSFSEAEAAITSIERVDAMSRLPQEKSMKTEEQNRPAPSWPAHGSLEFENVCMRYREGLPLSLTGLSFKIPAGKRCGIVGRTGAGKSSLTTALFRLVEIESGRVMLDGVDLGVLGLSDVRGRPQGLSIIPQNPFLAGTTLRECLDPFGHCGEKEVLTALVDVRLAPSDADLSVLSTKVEEGGSNFSVGERQLLNLARSILMKPRVLVLDEATASIDGETDAFVQKMLRTKFVETTMLTVAHRLNTIMDYDLILVMDAGKAAEFGSPKELLVRDGLFSQLVDATGAESSKALREIANSTGNVP
ncbi:Oligomycin resistance ATP-dependent permease YOR1 [Seminavis robusta]|uniref:Oligomycin resistance ATP-dependent permease YOR1 n=1 Tax=Seminavis robusta TaxID=568900 RepID=A0A9N8DJZ0_9STRA|nr:Oligomycin resistance ATP-dependent permease YOR1 [Seminavis robusta]|eukprot:Sro200_g084620.1 Oligomycin resistance ATP-dependent permease YOR1 (1396) ;mRNA; r:21120-26165